MPHKHLEYITYLHYYYLLLMVLVNTISEVAKVAVAIASALVVGICILYGVISAFDYAENKVNNSDLTPTVEANSVSTDQAAIYKDY